MPEYGLMPPPKSGKPSARRMRRRTRSAHRLAARRPGVACRASRSAVSRSCAFGRADCRTVRLGPCEVQALRLLIQCPFDVDAPLRDRQGAKLRGVGAKLVERHRDGDDGARRHPDIGSRNREFRLVGIIEGFGSAADDRGKVRAAPSCLQKQVVRASEREQPALDRLLRVLGSLARRADSARRWRRRSRAYS